MHIMIKVETSNSYSYRNQTGGKECIGHRTRESEWKESGFTAQWPTTTNDILIRYLCQNVFACLNFQNTSGLKCHVTVLDVSFSMLEKKFSMYISSLLNTQHCFYAFQQIITAFVMQCEREMRFYRCIINSFKI